MSDLGFLVMCIGLSAVVLIAMWAFKGSSDE
jgi:hypothetical protein